MGRRLRGVRGIRQGSSLNPLNLDALNVETMNLNTLSLDNPLDTFVHPIVMRTTKQPPVCFTVSVLSSP